MTVLDHWVVLMVLPLRIVATLNIQADVIQFGLKPASSKIGLQVTLAVTAALLSFDDATPCCPETQTSTAAGLCPCQNDMHALLLFIPLPIQLQLALKQGFPEKGITFQCCGEHIFVILPVLQL